MYNSYAHAIQIILLVTLVMLVCIIIGILLSKLRRQVQQPHDWLVTEVFFIHYSIKTKGGIQMVQAKVDQKFDVNWSGPKDKYGNAASVQEGSVTFSSDDESIATVEADTATGQFAAKVRTHDKPGATAIRIKAVDGDGSGDLEGQLAVEVVAGDAVGFGEATNTTPVDDEDEG